MEEGLFRIFGRMLEHSPVLRFILEIGGGLFAGAIVAALLFGAILKFAVSNTGELVKHDMFPTVANFVCIAVTVGVAFATGGVLLATGALVSSSMAAVNFHEKLVKIRDDRRKKDLDAK